MTDHTSQKHQSGWIRNLPLAVILMVAALGAVIFGDAVSFETLQSHRETLLGWRDRNPVGLAMGFCCFYVLIVAFSLPGAAVTSVAGGFLFGLPAGVFLNVVSATTGAAFVFLVAGYGPGDQMAARLDAAEGRVRRIRLALRENEVSVLLILRLIPVLPFFLVNLLLAMVGIPFRRFVWTTALGIVPGAIVFTWIGVGVGEVFDRGDIPDLTILWEPHVLGPLMGLCLLAALPMLLRILRGHDGV